MPATRCSEPSKTFSIISEPSTVTSRLNPRMTPLRNPMANMREYDHDEDGFDEVYQERIECRLYLFRLEE